MTSNKHRLYGFLSATALVASVLAIILVSTGNATGTSTATNLDNLRKEIVDRGVIRCGYVIYPPGCRKDPNTNQLTGVFVEALEIAAKRMDLRVDWVEEVGWGTMIEGLLTHRYDLIGSPVWANSTRAKLVDFTTPLFYSGIGVFVRADDHRFDESLGAIDDSTVRIATIDGEMSAIIASQDYPQATTVSLPQLSDNSQLLLNVLDKKADVAFVEPFIANLFLASRPGALRNVTFSKPIRVFPNTMMVGPHQPGLRSMLNTALSELLADGTIERLLEKHAAGGSFYPVALPYRVPGKNR